MTVVLQNVEDFERLIISCRERGMEDFSDEMILELTTAFQNSPKLTLNQLAFSSNIGVTKQEFISYAKKIGIDI